MFLLHIKNELYLKYGFINKTKGYTVSYYDKSAEL